MHVRIVAVDKLRSAPMLAACDEFRSRLRPYHTLEEIEVRASHGDDPRKAMREERERIFKHLRPDDRLWLLERTGVAMDSREFAKRLDDSAINGVSRLTFVVAGTFGADEALLQRADVVWSLSPLTFLHEWARALVLEQLYRAAKISRNEPYHH